jgi:hypothetical protein
MQAVARAFYRNPVIFLGACQAAIATAVAEGVLGSANWVGVAVIAAIVPLQRHFVEPAAN